MPLWFNIYVALAVLSGLIFAILFAVGTKEDDPDCPLSGRIFDYFCGMVAGALWPLSIPFFGVGWFSDFLREWFDKKVSN